ncbi:MAG: hypothetical protein ABFR33_04575 [Verrucomicrobiota bacterium]
MMKEPYIPQHLKNILRYSIFLVLCSAVLFLSGCALTKIVTVPVKAVTGVVGGTADVID